MGEAQKQPVSNLARVLAVTLIFGIGVLLYACTRSTPAEDAADLSDGKFISDMDARGVPTSQLDGTAGAKLGHALCDDLASGSQADAKVLQVANLQTAGNTDEFTTPQAEEIVYWAITELCPTYSGQRQDHWRDGE